MVLAHAFPTSGEAPPLPRFARVSPVGLVRAPPRRRGRFPTWLRRASPGSRSASIGLDPPPGTGPGPIRQDPPIPFHGNWTVPAGDAATSAIQGPGAEALGGRADAGFERRGPDGKRGLPFVAQSTCHPGGVPGQLLTPAEPFYFIQTPKEVWMIWQRDHMVRRIYLDRQAFGKREAVMVRRVRSAIMRATARW